MIGLIMDPEGEFKFVSSIVMFVGFPDVNLRSFNRRALEQVWQLIRPISQH
jgi:hypothetical protein